MMSLRFLLIAALFATGCGPDAGGTNDDVPDTHVLLREGACRGCRIVAETLAVLGQDVDTIAINEGATPVADSRGRFYLLEKGGRSVLVFGPDGRLMTTFGRAGKGPGEFDRISEIHAAPGDTLLVIGGGVVHVIDPTYRHVRQHSFTGGGDAEFFNTMLSDGRVLRMSGHNEFTLMERDGTPAAPVTLQMVDTASCSDCGERTFREGLQSGTVWSGQQNRYRVEQHDLSGAFLRGFVRKVHWFPDWSPAGEGGVNDLVTLFSRPRLFGVRQSGDGLLWTHVLMIDDPDKIPTPASLGFGSDQPISGDAINRVMHDVLANFVTMVEVIDPDTQEALVYRELKMLVIPMMRDMVAQMRLDQYGDWSCVVMKLRLEGRSGS